MSVCQSTARLSSNSVTIKFVPSLQCSPAALIIACSAACSAHYRMCRHRQAFCRLLLGVASASGMTYFLRPGKIRDQLIAVSHILTLSWSRLLLSRHESAGWLTCL